MTYTREQEQAAVLDLQTRSAVSPVGFADRGIDAYVRISDVLAAVIAERDALRVERDEQKAIAVRMASIAIEDDGEGWTHYHKTLAKLRVAQAERDRAAACIERVRVADHETRSWETFGRLVRIALAEYDEEAE